MGVTGLWKLIESSGKPVPVDTLENKVLAIDISIWLHQVVKGFQDNKGGNLPNAHLLGLFHRLCKLLYYRVKPVFIFDGGVPQLKRDTIAKRSQSRNKLYSEADRIQDLILQNLVRDKVVQKALGDDICVALVSPSKQKPTVEKPSRDEMFKLPSLPNENNELDLNITSCTDATSETDSSCDETNLRHSYNTNLQAIDVTSEHFKTLPADVRHEILTDIRETRKQSSWGRLHELPAKANDFSGFQMKRLLKRRQVQVSLEEAEKQMEGKSLTLAELETLMSEEGILRASETNAAKRIASDENTRFLLVKDLKKAVENAQKDLKMEVKEEKGKEEVEKSETIDELGREYEVDLQKAIEMSLECSTQVYKDGDYDCEGEVKLNEDQRQELKTAANSLARAYMLEYGGFNDEEIKDLICDEVDGDMDLTTQLESSLKFNHNDRFIVKGEICTPYRDMPGLKRLAKEALQTKQTSHDEVQYISSSDDSDLEEVVEAGNPSTKSNLQIVIDPMKAEYVEENDLFADIFEQAKPNQSSAVNGGKLYKTEGFTSQGNNKPKSNSVEQAGIDELAPVLNKASNNQILEKIKNEIQQISSITLDDISVQKDILPKSVTKEISLEIEKRVNVNDKHSEDDELEIVESNSEQVLSEISLHAENVRKTVKEAYATAGPSQQERQSHKPDESTENMLKKLPDTSSNLEEILQHVKQQSNRIPDIQLDDINLSKKAEDVLIVDITSEETTSTQGSESKLATNTEIIEIIDNELPIMKTPSKGSQSTIDEFFEAKFTVKRTPEKETSPPPSDVTSPFFVNKSGGSSGKKRKSPTSETVPLKKSRTAKQLFEDVAEKEGEQPMSSSEPTDVIEEVAKTLRENKTQSELEHIAGDIREETKSLELERNRQNRMATSITEKMAGECKQLLRLFGIPYIVAPMEAEAQCAFLDAIKLTDGTITDDSDIWLFGGRTVYKNFFNQKKHVLEFKMENVEKLFNIDRHKLIQLAILVGSDYTTGIHGIGAVTAIEILANFPTIPMKEGETTEIMSVLSSLRKFRDWWKSSKLASAGGRNALRSKLKNVQLYEGFPSMNIADAYLHPTIDDNREAFAWGEPDIETILEFTKTKFGWTRTKTDEILQPVLKRQKDRKTQVSIKNYFAVKSATSVRELKVSKRVQKAIDKMSGDYVETPPPKPKERKTRKKAEKSDPNVKKPATKRRKTKIAENVAVAPDEDKTDLGDDIVIPEKTLKKSPVIPNTKQTIPQREKDKKDMELRKKKAAELFKKASSTS